MMAKTFFKKFSPIEWFVIAVIGAVLIAILLPSPRWASDGSIRLPVRVFVFDLESGTPISGVRVLLFRCSLVSSPETLAISRDRFPADRVQDLPAEYWNSTDVNGSVMIEHEFDTGASHNRPARHAHLGNVWVRVESDGFGSVAIPIRHDSQPVSLLLQQGPIVVQIGLKATKPREVGR